MDFTWYRLRKILGNSHEVLKKTLSNMTHCTICQQGILVRETHPQIYTYQEDMITIDQPGDYCDHCGEGILNGEDLRATEKQLNDFQAKIEGLLTSQEIRQIRKRLKLTQKQAADIFGGGVNAFSRYERGEVKPIKAVNHLLRILDKHPELLNELETASK